MARRFTTKGIRWPKVARKRPIWVNIPFGGVNFSETVGRQLLMVPEDWEASFTGLANERAVLRAIVGEVVFSQLAVGTAGGNFFWGIYAAGIDKAVPVFTTTGMSDVRWLRTGARATSSVVTQSATVFSSLMSQQIDVRAKLALTSNMQLSICAQYGADAASPAGMMSGILRFLVARD
jgi:hypothetical protein